MAIESKMSRGPIGRSPFSESSEKNSGGKWVFIGVVVLLMIVSAGFYFFPKHPSSDALSQLQSGSQTSSAYQAVFLDNGQVYFGKLDRTNSDFYALTDVFYLKAGAAGIDQTANVALSKLGFEAHGPTDRMELNKSHILFIEDMKSDSKVVQAIQQYKQ